MKHTNRAEGTPKLKPPLLTFFPLKKYLKGVKVISILVNHIGFHSL